MLIAAIGLMVLAQAQTDVRCTRNENTTQCTSSTTAPLDYSAGLAAGQALVPKYEPRKRNVEADVAARVKAGDCKGAVKLALDAGSMTLAEQAKRLCQ